MVYEQLDKDVQRDENRKAKALKERSTLMQATRILGVLGFMLVLPIIAGAYIGHWLDSGAEEYSVRWTVGFILLGVVVGVINAYLMLREE